ncbi:hypothetical protein Sjap_019357 [Stephania japonica]|uniref:BRCA1-associated protein n=1 Tax=Stephania japonica TaxID=461633 RepID=A0AAP0HUM9_9MAGN
MTDTSTSGGGATAEDAFRSSAAMDSGDPSSHGGTQALPFSSGNPRIEETRGLMHLHPNPIPNHNNSDVSTFAPDLPVGRKPLVCVLGVPNHMTYADFCNFCGSFIQHIKEMRIVRNDGVEDRYSIIIRFDDQDLTDDFYNHFNGKSFSSLEAEICQVLFTIDIQYTGSIEHAQTSLAGSTDQPTCAVCLERLDQDMGGILTTICNHSFHCSCISKWTDSSCPVCRYCQQQPEKSTCIVCGTTENLCICVICGFVGCGRNKESHAIGHWKETQHCYSLELETQRVWDYVKDNYVHRLILSKTDGKPVELNSHCVHGNESCGNCECSANSEISEIVSEYNELLASQLESQRIYFESVLQDMNAETDKMVSKMVDKTDSSKLQKLQAKLNKSLAEKKFLDDLRVLMASLEGEGEKMDEQSQSQSETVSIQRNDGATSSVPAESSTACSTKKSGKSNNRRKK